MNVMIRLAMSAGVLFMVAAALPGATLAKAEFAGCADFKQFPAGDACILIECGAKRSDPVKLQVDAEHQDVVEGPSAYVRYACPAPATLDSVAEHLAPALAAAGYKIVYQDTDPNNRIITARKASSWLDVDASPADAGGISYTITGVESGPAKPLNGEICSEAGLLPLPKGCWLTDCNSKRKDKAEMRAAIDSEVALNGPVRISGFSCEASITTAGVFEAAKAALKSAEFEIVFSEFGRPDYSWMTARSGKRWVELMSTQDTDGISFQLTDILTDSAIRKQ